ncbi:MAG: hypothetical protein ACREBW_00815, partial [Candidatus Micrarchaeaceae archaeon]
ANRWLFGRRDSDAVSENTDFSAARQADRMVRRHRSSLGAGPLGDLAGCDSPARLVTNPGDQQWPGSIMIFLFSRGKREH